MKPGFVAIDDSTSSFKVPVEDSFFGSQRLQSHRVGEGMDSKGLDVCIRQERDKACWFCCCRDGRKTACHDSLYSLTVGLCALLVPAQFIYKTWRGSSNRTCKRFGGLGNHIEGTYSFEAQCSLPCLTTLTAASAHQADQSMQDQSSSNIIGTKSPLRQLSQSSIHDYQSPCAFQNLYKV